MLTSKISICALAAAAAAVVPASARAQRTASDSTPGMGSGTSWIPAAVPMPGRDFQAGTWSVMVHGFATGQVDRQSGPRGATQFGSVNWGMAMASHEAAGGTLTLRGMASLDVWGVSPRGYPELLQTGESYHGQPLHDRQHPHDVLMEIGALYDRPLRGPLHFELYAAPVGEPALGPPAFMHRPSAMDNPVAPIGHHWQDATHISYGVLTVGVFTSHWKLEGSAFNGREPDANRWNIDPIRLDSYAGRISYAPNREWTGSASYGFLASPEALHPQASVHRITASLMHSRALGDHGSWSTTGIWGANQTSGAPRLASSVLLESEAVLDLRNSVFARAEYVQKTADELDVSTAAIGVPADRLFGVSAVSLGFVRELTHWTHGTLGLGAMATVNVVPAALTATYGSRTSAGLLVFFRVRPRASGMGGMDGMPMGGMQMSDRTP